MREHELQRSWKRQWRSLSKTVWAQKLVVSSAQPHIGGVEIVGGHLGVDSILAWKIKMSVALKLRLREGNASETATGYPKSQSLNSNLILVARVITTRHPIQSYIPHLDTITRLDNRPFLIAQSTVCYKNYPKMFVKFVRIAG